MPKWLRDIYPVRRTGSRPVGPRRSAASWCH